MQAYAFTTTISVEAWYIGVRLWKTLFCVIIENITKHFKQTVPSVIKFLRMYCYDACMAYKNPLDPRRLLNGRRHYLNNKQAYIENSISAKKRLRAYVRTRKDKPCTDCGLEYPYYVMQFDHLGDKKYTIGVLVNLNNRAKLEIELAKCEVVCANCHAIRTHQRGIVQR